MVRSFGIFRSRLPRLAASSPAVDALRTRTSDHYSLPCVGSAHMQIYSQKDVDKKALKGARIAVLGYGSQGRAHALNLKDSGFDVVVGVPKGDTFKQGKRARPGGKPPH